MTEQVVQIVSISKPQRRPHKMVVSGINIGESVKKISALHFIVEAQSLIFILFILLLFKPESGNGQSYDEYHQMISTAEEYYFLQNNVDSALFYYQSCFEAFDFVFARDAINAIQIAYKERRPIEYFLEIALEAGVTPSILSNIPALNNFVQDSMPNLDLMQDYDLYRSRYLDRINVECLNSIYRLGIIDQISKTKRKPETGTLFKLGLAFGLPGEKNCGIEQMDIHKELGSGAANFLNIRDSISEKSGRNLRYYSLDNNSLIMYIPIVIMLHDYCTYKDYERSLLKAYSEGYIHPREIGCIYDNSYRGESNCKMFPIRGIFGLNTFVNSSNMDTKKANQLRAKWGICSVETDQKKKELEKTGFKFIWDYW